MADPFEDYRVLLETYKNTYLAMEPIEDERFHSGFLKLLIIWFEKVLNAIDQGKPIVQNQFTLFSELSYAFDLAPNPAEVWAGIIFLLRDGYGACPSFDAAHEAGIAPELCSAYKGVIGGLMRGSVPKPAIILSATFPCDNSKMGDQIAAELTGAPTYWLDCPYYPHEPEAMEYWVNQIKGLISFLEEQTGRKLDPDRLKEVAEETNRAVEYWLETLEMRKMVPLPQRGLGPIGLVTACSLLGSPEGTEIMKFWHDDIKDRIAKGKTAVPQENLRMIWWYLIPAHDILMIDSLEEEKGAVSPLSFWDYTGAQPIDTSSTESIIRGMARRNLEQPMARQGIGPVDIYIDDCIRCVQEWKGDCVINAGHVGCKWLYASHGLLSERLRQIGIPSMIFECDVFDPRVARRPSYGPQLEKFVDTVIAQKRRR
jgi:benzoyl-CoA reductase/2-hydroxyglutaryl-CoA dehydratase subunit BcrC/BadD/HgdB